MAFETFGTPLDNKLERYGPNDRLILLTKGCRLPQTSIPPDQKTRGNQANVHERALAAWASERAEPRMIEQLPWVVEGIVGGSGAFLLAVVGVSAWEWCKKNLPRVTRSRHLASASASKDLMPIIGGLTKKTIPVKGSELWLFSGDGSYMLTRNGERWRRKIIEWARCGLTVRYILLEASPAVRGKFRELMTDAGPNAALRVVVLCPDADIGEDELLKLRTCHPTLLIGANGQRAAWIEGYHEPMSEFAYNVDYIAPRDLVENTTERDRFDGYQSLMQQVMERCKPIPVSHAA